MNSRIPLILGIIVLVLGIVAYSATFTVHQTQQVIVLQFGDPKQEITEPGLHFKLPFVQEVAYLEKRILNLDPPSQTIILSGQLRLVVDVFVRYRIVNALRFIQSVQTEATLDARLSPIVNDATRSVLGDATLADVLSAKRVDMMGRIREQVNRLAEGFGIAIVDLRIGRADLAPQVSESVYERMRAERQRDAADFRAQGQEMYQTITAQADREAIGIRAGAQRSAEILRGEGEGARSAILNDAFGRDPDFFQFYRSMQAYRETIDPTTSYLVLTTDSDFFRYFNDSQGILGVGGASQGQPAPTPQPGD